MRSAIRRSGSGRHGMRGSLYAAACIAAGLISAQPTSAQGITDHAARRIEIEKRRIAPTPEALERRARSNARLAAEGVPTAQSLPVIETATEAKPRTAETVVRRAIALVLVANKGELNDQVLVDRLIADFGAAGDFTPKERAFIANRNTTRQERTQFLWRFEAVNVLLWAVGLVETLERADRIIDVGKVVTIFRTNDRASLLAKARLRPIAEILGEADLIYRTHWAVTEARINGRPAPAGLDGSVVYERHYAFNWLIGYLGQDWDDVTTDT